MTQNGTSTRKGSDRSRGIVHKTKEFQATPGGSDEIPVGERDGGDVVEGFGRVSAGDGGGQTGVRGNFGRELFEAAFFCRVVREREGWGIGVETERLDVVMGVGCLEICVFGVKSGKEPKERSEDVEARLGRGGIAGKEGDAYILESRKEKDG
jgi:hypothetical protein